MLHSQDCHFHCSELRYHRYAVNWSFYDSWNNGNSFSQGQSKLNDTEQQKRKPFSRCFAVTPPASILLRVQILRHFPCYLKHFTLCQEQPLCCIEKGGGCLCLVVFTCQIFAVSGNNSGLAEVFSHFAASSFTLLRLFFFRDFHAKLQNVWYAIV